MKLLLTLVVIVASQLWCTQSQADETVFSGPQIGEKISSFSMKGLDGKDIDPVALADGKPVVLVFFDATNLSRIAFGVARTALKFAESKTEKGMTSHLIILTDDVTSTAAKAKLWRNAGHFPKGSFMGVYSEGREGPGAYGLNRKVLLTVLVAKDNQVTGNFALVQPSVQADCPKIFKAIVDATGGGEVPTVAEFEENNYNKMGKGRGKPKMTRGRTAPGRNARGKAARPQAEQDPNLRGFLVPIIQKNATDDQIDAAVEKLEEYLAEHPKTKVQVGDIARRIIGADRLSNYGTEHAQSYLTKWAKDYKAKKPQRGEQEDKK